MSADSLTATFQSDSLLFPGETVFATLTTGIAAASGATLGAGYVWQFTGAVLPQSPGEFTPGEDVDSSAFNTGSTVLGDVNGDGAA